MPVWEKIQLSFGSRENRFHAHSYYDISALCGDRALAHRMDFAGRMPTPKDRIEIGLIDLNRPGSWERIGDSAAWSWQQGPMAQFAPQTSDIVYNDREGPQFVSRLITSNGERKTFAAPVYALSRDGRFALSLNMARLNWLRPGYGYAGGRGFGMRRPDGDGVRRIDLKTGESELILTVKEAFRFMLRHLPARARMKHLALPNFYWFNHAKISPDSKRFTIKLRWRLPGRGWNDAKGVSLTASVDGGDLRFLADRTSHVIWEDSETLFLFRSMEVVRYRDENPGVRLGPINLENLHGSPHVRALPNRRFVYDTPYQETISLKIYDENRDANETIATFNGHRPANGPFRCDLHACPSLDGKRIIVTSLEDGGRQLYLLQKR